MTQKIEGYWFEEPFSHLSKPSPYPMPIPDVLTQEEADKIYELILEKEKTAKKELYRGWTTSRITGENLGNAEYETPEWIWPGDFSKHYVKEHRVKPTDDFLKFIGYDKMKTIRGNTLEYWKQNAEENYITTPISVLKYITILEELISKSDNPSQVEPEEKKMCYATEDNMTHCACAMQTSCETCPSYR